MPENPQTNPIESQATVAGHDPVELLNVAVKAAESSATPIPPERWELPLPDEVCAMLDGYVVTSILGRGGMGAVYRGVQNSLEREVAIKLLPPELGVDPEFEARFHREAKAMAKLNHSNIVQIYDFGQTSEGYHYFVMEFVDGTDLYRMIRTGQLDSEGALNAISQICDALEYAHDEGFVHRDIKPANIFINNKGILKVGDFGLAKLVGGEVGGDARDEPLGLTMTGVTLGTPHYIAPEQMVEGCHVDRRADIYSLGVMFYEMLTGEIPRGAVKPPSQKTRAADKALDVRIDGVVFKAMESDPDERYQTATDLRIDVDGIRMTPEEAPVDFGSEKHMTTPSGESDRTPKAGANSRPSPALIVFAGLAILLAVGLGIFWLGDFQEGKATASNAENEEDTRIAIPVAESGAIASVKAEKASTPEKGIIVAQSENPPPTPTDETTVAREANAADANLGKFGDLSNAAPIELQEAKSEPGRLESILPSEQPLAESSFKLPTSEGQSSQPASPSDPVGQRLAGIEAGFRDRYLAEVGEAHEAAVERLGGQIVAALKREEDAAAQAGNLDAVLAWKRAGERLSSKRGVPGDAEIAAESPPVQRPERLLQFYVTYRTEFAKLEAARIEKAASLLALRDQAMELYQQELTKAQDIEGALRVKAYREQAPDSFGPSDVKVPTSAEVASPSESKKPSLNSGNIEVYRLDGSPVPASDSNPLLNFPDGFNGDVVDLAINDWEVKTAAALLKDGTVRVWGSEPTTTPTDPTLGAQNIVSLCVGVQSVLMLDRSGKVWVSAPGTGLTKSRVTRIELPGKARAISGSETTALILLEDGSVHRLVRHTANTSPIAVPPGKAIVSAYSGFILGQDNIWRHVDDNDSVKEIGRIEPELVAASCFQHSLQFIDARNEPLHLEAGANLNSPPKSPIRVSNAGQFVITSSTSFVRSEGNRWHIKSTSKSVDERKLEAALRGCFQVVVIRGYVFALREQD
ncbi:MAG: serine/threonine protein kinase [Verrucomicrobiae bacterium]|nr:serine/threonine protein kinase [Verrucomicrobiae bacterium]